MQNLTVNYDNTNDILYISLGAPVPSICEEKEEGIIVRKRLDNSKISGVTILDYKYRIRNKMKIEVPKEINLKTIKI